MRAFPGNLALEADPDPDGLLPEQWDDRLRAPASGELRLMAAVLMAAIRDYRMHGSSRPARARHLGRLAKQWIEARDRSWPYSFESICGAFDIDPALLRSRLARERRLDATTPARDRSRHDLVLTDPGPNSRRRGSAGDAPAYPDGSRAVA